MKKGRVIKTIIKILLTTGLLTWFLYRTDLNKILASWNLLSFNIILGVILIYCTAIFVNSIKWFILLPQYSILKLYIVNFIGQYYSILLPGQITGEAVKAYRLGKGKKDAEQVAASVLIDKVTGFIGILIVGITGFFFTNKDISLWVVMFFLCGILICIITLLSLQIKFIYFFILKNMRILEHKLLKFSKHINKIIYFIKAWSLYSKRLKVLFLNIILGVIFQLLAILILFFLAKEMGIFLAFIEWCWIFAIVSTVLFLPLTIGGIGMREGTFIGILGGLGISNEKALALSLSIFGLQLLGAFIGGVFEWTTNIGKS